MVEESDSGEGTACEEASLPSPSPSPDEPREETGGGYGAGAVFGSWAGRVEVLDRRSTGWRAP